MNPAASVTVAVTFVWLGMVLAISFMEAPLKFRAPDVTLRVGLGIGRLVFRALNTVEAVFAAAIVVALIVGSPCHAVVVPAAVAVAVLIVQLAVVRPRLSRRSNAVLAGGEGARSHSHHVYIVCEVVKVLAVLAAGIAMLATGG